MDKKLNFADYLNLLMGTREKQILHDLSNKFNLLTLAIEDLEDALEETPSENSDWKSSIGGEISSLKDAKKKFQDLTNQMKGEASSKMTSLALIWETVVSCHHRELNRKSIELELALNPDREVPFTSAFNLLNGLIVLRIHLCSNLAHQKVSINLNDKNLLLSNERLFLENNKDLLEENFEENYLNLISSWQRDSLF